MQQTFRSMRLLSLASFVLLTQGCAWAVRDISALEDVDIAAPEPLSESPSPPWYRSKPEASEASGFLRGKPCEAGKPQSACPTKGSFLDVRSKALAADSEQHDVASQQQAKNAARFYFERGITLFNTLCSEWFGRLNRSGTAISETRDTLANTGSTAATIMGATNASSTALAVVAATFGFGRQAATDLSTNYVMTADIGQVQQMLNDYRAKYVHDIFTTDDREDFDRATRALNLYHGLCSAPTVRTLINRSIRTADLHPDNEATAFEDTIIKAAIRSVQPYFADVAIDRTALIDLYVLQEGTALALPKEQLEKAVVKIKASLIARKIMDESGKLRTDGTQEAKKALSKVFDELRTAAGSVLDPAAKRMVGELTQEPPPETAQVAPAPPVVTPAPQQPPTP